MQNYIFPEICVSLMSDQSPLARTVKRLRKLLFKRLISSLDTQKVFQRIGGTVNGDSARACDRYWAEVAGLRDTVRGRFSRTKNGIHFQLCLVAHRVLCYASRQFKLRFNLKRTLDRACLHFEVH
jgi:hypothetical protein